MPDALIHPTPPELTAFGLGQLAEAAAAAVAGHLEICPVCRQAVENLPPNAFLSKVQATRPSDSSVPPGRAATLPGGTSGGGSASSASPAPAPGLPPELVNHPRYRIVRELGRGGMGVVYQAVQPLMDRPVAIKVINPSVLAHPDALPRFQSEVKTAAKLDHPNIVRAHDAEQVGGLHLLVMEYVEGASLADLVQRKGPLSVAHACHFVRQAALGLQHAFEQGMVHRDIKPQNLMVTPKGVVKILDFGLARLRGGQTQGGGLTEVGAFMGTPEYVSPEQATDARTADTRADLYSLGCTLYFLLTGQPPFPEDTPVKTVLAHIEKPPPSLTRVRPEVPAELAAVVERLLAKDPARRYQRPVEVAQALVPFIKQGTKPEGTARPAAGTGIAAGATPGRLTNPPQAIAAKTPPLATPAKEETPAPFAALGNASTLTSKPKKPAPAWYRRPPVLAGAGAAVLVLGLGVWLLTRGNSTDKEKPPEGGPVAVIPPSSPPTSKETSPSSGARGGTPSSPDKAKDVDPSSSGQDQNKESPSTAPKPEETKPPENPPVPAPTPPNTEAKKATPATTPVPKDTSPPAKKPDPFEPLIKKAREEYEAAMKRADAKLLAAFTQKLNSLPNTLTKLKPEDRLKVIEAVKAEQATFEKHGILPWSPSMRSGALEYIKDYRTAATPVYQVYKNAMDYHLKAHDDETAATLAADKKEFLASKVVGRWNCVGTNFRNRFTHTLYANGKVGDPVGNNVWVLSKSKLVLYLHNPAAPRGLWVDTCTMRFDGQNFTARNQKGGAYQATLIRPAD